MPPKRISGVIAAVVTPVDETLSPDINRFLRHARWALDNGCDGLNVLGTTGEANSLSATQRVKVMEATAGDLGGKRLMVGTGTPDLATTIDLTRVAHELGYACALILPPYYYKAVSDDGLHAWFSEIIRQTADRPIPIYLYNFPQMTGLRFSPELARRLAADFPERIAGAKDSSGDLGYAAELARIDGFDVFPSNEVALARAGTDGYAGCISATVNVAPSLSAKLWSNRDDMSVLEEVRTVRMGVSAQPLIPSVKYLVGRIHGDTVFQRLLPPHLELTDDQKSALAQIEAAVA